MKTRSIKTVIAGLSAVAVIVGGRYLLQPVMHRIARTRSRETFTAFTVLLVLGSALLTEHLGLSMAMGAFLAGLLISDSAYRHQVIAEIQPFRGLLLGVFFMSIARDRMADISGRLRSLILVMCRRAMVIDEERAYVRVLATDAMGEGGRRRTHNK